MRVRPRRRRCSTRCEASAGWSRACCSRCAGIPPAWSKRIREIGAGLDGELNVRVDRIEDNANSAMAASKMAVGFASALAVLALLLACSGIAGVVAFAVGRRRREVGIRMALGSSPGGAVGFMMRRGMTPVFAGLVSRRRGCAGRRAAHAGHVLRGETIRSAQRCHRGCAAGGRGRTLRLDAGSRRRARGSVERTTRGIDLTKAFVRDILAGKLFKIKAPK